MSRLWSEKNRQGLTCSSFWPVIPRSARSWSEFGGKTPWPSYKTGMTTSDRNQPPKGLVFYFPLSSSTREAIPLRPSFADPHPSIHPPHSMAIRPRSVPLHLVAFPSSLHHTAPLPTKHPLRRN